MSAELLAANRRNRVQDCCSRLWQYTCQISISKEICGKVGSPYQNIKMILGTYTGLVLFSGIWVVVVLL